MSFFRINNNLGTQQATQERLLNDRIGSQLKTSMERLSSGRRINQAGDDVAGMRVASTLQTRYTALNEANNNVQSGINLANTADRGLESVNTRLDSIRELTVRAGNPAMDPTSRQSIQNEIDQQIDEIARIAQDTQFGSTRLLNGDLTATSVTLAPDEANAANEENAASEENATSEENVANGENAPEAGNPPNAQTTLEYDTTAATPGEQADRSDTLALSAVSQQVNFQAGANAEQTLATGFGDVRPESLGLGAGQRLSDIDVTGEESLNKALAIVDEAIGQVGEMRGEIGAVSNRLNSAANEISVEAENILAASSRITDTDYAAETSKQSVNQMILQANLSVQSQSQNLMNNLFVDLLR